jgi:putative hydrolase
VSRTPTAAVDRRRDLHTHSDLTDGTASPAAMADAAVAAGLHTWGLSDHVRADSDWVDEYLRLVRGLRRDGLEILCGVEAKILDSRGRLDLPTALPDLDYVLVADHQYPAAGGPVHPRDVARAIAAGAMLPADVVDELVVATCAAVQQAPLPVIVAHPFSLLPKMGLSETDVRDDHLRALAAACRTVDAAVEINGKWRCPSARIVADLSSAGVDLVAGSDAHRPQDVGAFGYVDVIGAVHQPGADAPWARPADLPSSRRERRVAVSP